MKISELIEILEEVKEVHGDLPVTAHCIDAEIERATLLQASSAEWEPGAIATEIFLES